MINASSNVPDLRRVLGITALLLTALPLVATAHHSFGLYSDDVTEIQGELIDVSWRNPHVRFIVQTTDSAGQEETWTLEGAAGYILQRRGLAQDLFQLGDRITVAGRPHMREPSLIWLHNILLGDGRELLMIGGVEPRWTTDPVGGDQTLAIEDAVTQDQRLFRVWSQPILRPITYGTDLPYRETPPSGGADWIERLNGYAARCEPVGMPGVMATPYPFDFTDNGSSIRLRGFSNNAPIDRTIWLSEEGSPAGQAPDRMGYSRGRWENEQVLVVHTTQIDWPYFDDSAGTPQSDDMEITEVFTLSTDQKRLDYRMTVTDPELFTEAATVIETYWVALGEALVQPPDCAN